MRQSTSEICEPPGEVLRGQSESFRLKAQSVGLGRREIDRQFHGPTLSCPAVSSNNRLEQAGFAGCSSLSVGRRGVQAQVMNYGRVHSHAEAVAAASGHLAPL
jgi:hypothetical protein